MTPLVKTFEYTGETFGAFRAAEAFARELGYTVGSMQRGAPIGLHRDAEYISKWRNMTSEEQRALDGRIESGDFREGSVTVTLYR